MASDTDSKSNKTSKTGDAYPIIDHTFDVVVVGAGGSGLRATMGAAEAGFKTANISKVFPTRSHTVAAQGGIAAVLDAGDTFEDHIRDTMVAGAGLNDRDTVEFVIERAPHAIDRLIELGSVPEPMAQVLRAVVASRRNVLISGGTGSGKRIMLNALSRMIDPGERVLTIEDAAELRLQQPHWLPLETRPPNLEGQGAITIGDLVKNALRMRPDRIILGEIRGHRTSHKGPTY